MNCWQHPIVYIASMLIQPTYKKLNSHQIINIQFYSCKLMKACKLTIWVGLTKEYIHLGQHGMENKVEVLLHRGFIFWLGLKPSKIYEPEFASVSFKIDLESLPIVYYLPIVQCLSNQSKMLKYSLNPVCMDVETFKLCKSHALLNSYNI